MHLGWLIGATVLLIVIYCFTIYTRTVVMCKKSGNSKGFQKTSLVLMVRNQEGIIEGLVREIFAYGYLIPIEVVVFDFGSADKTGLILERLARDYPGLRFFACCGEEKGVPKKVMDLCHSDIVYCFNLTSSVNYSLIIRTVESILGGTKMSLYRTTVLYKNKTQGRCTVSRNVLK
ncbi:hypothetical protein [Phosphitispora fastidiosa]|uniref:hypothetical protein n=1 Tax=Phosphitispora fastidiosa TaxID=2837202 RepID=UPI001E3C707E|nr:hypothetical protein [Phosphitispora fastidiosa]MBU7008223.1 glycosyltransferase involved in cell wall biosynthesis [Phosphitispora fastidiosa]